MLSRNGTGTIMILTAILTVVLLLLGTVGYQIVSLLGGGREAQNAADAGTLDVAKHYLSDVSVPLTETELRYFGDLAQVDPVTRKKVVNLESYNRLIGKAVLMRLNAEEAGTQAAKDNARTVRDALNRLTWKLRIATANYLSGDPQHGAGGIFKSMATKNRTAMIGNHGWRYAKGDGVDGDTQVHGLAFLARGTSSNLYMTDDMLPPGITLDSRDFVQKGTRKFLKGYEPLFRNQPQLIGDPLYLMPVPDQPRLVSPIEFDANTNPPHPVLLPMNAIKTSTAVKLAANGKYLHTTSYAVTGLGPKGKVYGAGFPKGVIVVDNSGLINFTGSRKSQFDFWGDVVMSPKSLDLLQVGKRTIVARIDPAQKAVNPAREGLDPVRGVAEKFKDVSESDLGRWNEYMVALQKALDAALGRAPGDGGWVGPDGNGHPNYANPLIVTNEEAKLLLDHRSLPHCNCDNTSFGTNKQMCDDHLKAFTHHFYPEDPGQGLNGEGSAVEAYHAAVLFLRGQIGRDVRDKHLFADLSMQQIYPYGSSYTLHWPPHDNDPSTGLKDYPRYGCPLHDTLVFPPGNPTLYNLLGRSLSKSFNKAGQLVTYTGQAQINKYWEIVNSWKRKMRQIKPDASEAELQRVLTTHVPFGKKSYIYLDDNNTLGLHDQRPTWLQSSDEPDGEKTWYFSDFSLDGICNTPNDGGYPHPWDCPKASQGWGEDSVEYTPGSGFNNVLGKVKFRNRAYPGSERNPYMVTFRCPC